MRFIRIRAGVLLLKDGYGSDDLRRFGYSEREIEVVLDCERFTHEAKSSARSVANQGNERTHETVPRTF